VGATRTRTPASSSRQGLRGEQELERITSPLRWPATWGNAGLHSGEAVIADKRRCRPAGGARSWVKIGWLPADVGCLWWSEAVDTPGAGSRAWALDCCLEHADQIGLLPCGSCGQPPVGRSTGRPGVLEETQETEEIIQRVAALGRGQGRADLLCAGPRPGRAGPAAGRRSGPTRR
jgi:hypothetical protein